MRASRSAGADLPPENHGALSPIHHPSTVPSTPTPPPSSMADLREASLQLRQPHVHAAGTHAFMKGDQPPTPTPTPTNTPPPSIAGDIEDEPTSPGGGAAGGRPRAGTCTRPKRHHAPCVARVPSPHSSPRAHAAAATMTLDNLLLESMSEDVQHKWDPSQFERLYLIGKGGCLLR